ncbi:Ni/Fe hydrogenase subunit alpha [Fontivita pretiosa]|uniref:Ni/Fe hydrogenase subunit alpha n=1 Tax=Fontivita pretiosa TaxID=2989684 RepID=UPI003D16EAE5
MSREIVIDPVTRIEGHAKITLRLGDDGNVKDAMFHVTQFRGFEKFCEGRPLSEMPSLMARTCGICPVSHLMAASKACDQLLAVKIPRTAEMLRRVMNLAQIIQSHALSFFHLSSPDLLMGMDADPARRNIFGVLEQNPELARDGIRLRQIGQTIIEILGGKRIHPAWTVPGGVNEPLTAEKRDRIRGLLPEALEIGRRTITWFKRSLDQFSEEARSFGSFPTWFMGLVTPKGGLEHYDGLLRICDSRGQIVQDMIPPERYQEIIGEAVEPFSYMKFPYLRSKGYPEGIYRVGPLARLNIIDHCGTPVADQEWAEFREMHRGVVLSSFHYHYARLIEIIYCTERIAQLLDDPKVLDQHVRALARVNADEGIGVAEAPRGTLIHHYRVDDNGLITWANMIIATGHNNLAMNRGVLQVAQRFVDGARLREGMLNRVEALIRCYDPCLSCATHAVGQMPLHVQLVSASGQVLDEQYRN